MAFSTPKTEEPLDLSVNSGPITLRPLVLPYWGYHHMGYPGYPIHVPIPEPSPIWSNTCKPYIPSLLSPKVKSEVISPPQSPTRRRDVKLLEEEDTLSDDPEFQNFRNDALRAMAEQNGGSLLGHNPRMRRAVQTSHGADGAYRLQRDKNNIAAKQSRDRRKLRELQAALKVSYLKKRLARMKALLAAQECGACHRRWAA